MASYSGGIKLYAEIILRSLIDLETGKVADWSVRYNTADAPATVSFWSYSNDEYGRAVIDYEKCVSCGKCKRVCPMDVDVTDNSRQRLNGTECILCMECVRNCPKGAL